MAAQLLSTFGRGLPVTKNTRFVSQSLDKFWAATRFWDKGWSSTFLLLCIVQGSLYTMRNFRTLTARFYYENEDGKSAEKSNIQMYYIWPIIPVLRSCDPCNMSEMLFWHNSWQCPLVILHANMPVTQENVSQKAKFIRNDKKSSEIIGKGQKGSEYCTISTGCSVTGHKQPWTEHQICFVMGHKTHWTAYQRNHWNLPKYFITIYLIKIQGYCSYMNSFRCSFAGGCSGTVWHCLTRQVLLPKMPRGSGY